MQHKIRVRLGHAEFEAEGTEEKVQAQYEQFLAALERMDGGSAPSPAPKSDVGATDLNGEKPSGGTVDNAFLTRIFELRQDGVVALRVLPKGPDKEADALLLIIYGYRRLKNEEDILATQMLKAAGYSGISVDRLARSLAFHERLVIRGGHRKGTTYSLNNQGITKAEEIATKIFE